MAFLFAFKLLTRSKARLSQILQTHKNTKAAKTCDGQCEKKQKHSTPQKQLANKVVSNTLTTGFSSDYSDTELSLDLDMKSHSKSSLLSTTQLLASDNFSNSGKMTTLDEVSKLLQDQQKHFSNQMRDHCQNFLALIMKTLKTF